jgi:hypothetical protein
MSIQSNFDPTLRILFTTFVGAISFDDIQAHLDRETAEGLLPKRELIDATAASTILTTDEVKRGVERVFCLMRQGSFGPTVLITSNEYFFGMSRMFAILCELQGGPEVAAFRNKAEGLEWLGQHPAV